MLIGVLALQGAFIEHEQVLKKLAVDYVEIRKQTDLHKNIQGIILPGGESTTIGKLLHELDMFTDLKKKIAEGLPAFGTCAGMILLAKELSAESDAHFQLMDIKVKRNAYGRQLGSFKTTGRFHNMPDIPMVFIRAPYIESISANAEVLSIVDNHIVAARQKNMLVTAYHPELSTDSRIHEYFLNMIKDVGYN